MTAKYVLTEDAQRDLADIGESIAEASGLVAAEQVVSELRRAFRLLADSPDVGHGREDITDDPKVRFWSVYSLPRRVRAHRDSTRGREHPPRRPGSEISRILPCCATAIESPTPPGSASRSAASASIFAAKSGGGDCAPGAAEAQRTSESCRKSDSSTESGRFCMGGDGPGDGGRLLR